MRIRKLTSTNAFVAVDLDGVAGRGVVRLAPKILQGGAKNLARSMTYSLACLGRREAGVSAGISVAPEDGEAAVAAFVDEVAGWDDGYRFEAGKGVTPTGLGSLAVDAGDPLPGAVAAALAACPGASTAVADIGDPSPLAGLLADHGVEVLEADRPLTAAADLLFVGAGVGAVDHDGADGLGAKVVVPTVRLAVTTRALATCSRRGIVVLPDFVVVGLPADEAAIVVAEVLDHPEGPVLGACERAEAFLGSWQDELPFGRPI
ncbi:MAG: hypothetical protein H8E59_04625 [Actinobacteria bacterium]|nr:hypothetical protein [Actinomycetota bacterium]